MNQQPAYFRARYRDLAERRSFVDSLLQTETLVEEARELGYDKDPDVLAAARQAMLGKYLQNEFETHHRAEDVPEEAVRRYYQEHSEQFNRTELIRVCQIVVKDKAKAARVAALAHAVDRKDEREFRALVEKYSEDAESKERRGDLPEFGRNTTALPSAVVAAAYDLKAVGDSSQPIKADDGYHILKLMQRHPGYSRSLDEVRKEIQSAIARDDRTAAMEKLVAELKQKHRATIVEANLARINVSLGPDKPRTSLGAGAAVPGMGRSPAARQGAPGAAPAVGIPSQGLPAAPPSTIVPRRSVSPTATGSAAPPHSP